MLREAQAAAAPARGPLRWRALALVLASGLLPACAGGFELDRLGADRSLTTGSIGTAPATQEGERASDEAAIRAAVETSPFGPEPPGLMPWVNARTGSSGTIERTGEAPERGSICFAFTASRESFDGVGLYHGRACGYPGGSWKVKTLERA